MSAAGKLPVLCPSGRCAPGSLLLGVVQGDGVAFLADRVEVDAAFVAAAKQAGDPERRLRFAEPCMGGGCGQWTGTRCGVIDKVLSRVERQEPDGLPACAIRGSCRWFHQSGPPACAACPLVVTDSRPAIEPLAASPP